MPASSADGSARQIAALAVGLVLLAACGDGPAAPDAVEIEKFDDGCDHPTALDECFVGDFFAECGGGGAPRLGCTDSDCLWFTGGCVATGFLPSDCPADHVCCADRWPYPVGEFESPIGHQGDHQLYLQLLGFGLSPWDRGTELTLTGRVDPSVASQPDHMTCTGLAPDPTGPCGAEPSSLALPTLRDTLTIISVLEDSQVLGGWYLWLEVIPTDGGTLSARACMFPFIDYWVTACPDYGAPRCADAGDVRLSRWPSSQADLPGLAVGTTLVFPGGMTVDWVGRWNPPPP